MSSMSEKELFEYLRTHFLVLGDYTIKYNGEKWDTITGRTESWTITKTLPIFENEEDKNE